MKPRIIALDVGSKRVGVAVSDALGMMAHNIGLIKRSSFQKEMEELKRLVDKYRAGALLVGLPLNMNGTDSEQTQNVRQYAEKIRKTFPELEFILRDERLSTSAGERILIAADVSRGKRKLVIDGMAAQWVLQGYLDQAAAAKGDES